MGLLKVRDIMTTQVMTLSPDNTISEAIKKLAVENLTGAPVVDKDSCMVGIISQNDILGLFMKYAAKIDSMGGNGSMLLASGLDSDTDDPVIKGAIENISKMKVRDIMIHTVLTTRPDADLIPLVKAMLTLGVSRVPVIEKGVLIGIVTGADIIFSVSRKRRS